jgi:hypothetical protein
MLFEKALRTALVGAMAVSAANVVAVAQSDDHSNEAKAVKSSWLSLPLPPALESLYRNVKHIRPTQTKWQRIPWMSDLAEAVRQARVESRPILIWSTSDDPIGRC